MKILNNKELSSISGAGIEGVLAGIGAAAVAIKHYNHPWNSAVTLASAYAGYQVGELVQCSKVWLMSSSLYNFSAATAVTIALDEFAKDKEIN